MNYCPYTNILIPESDSNPEHIIPLSLGGNNDFVINVCKKANAKLGSEIDAKIGNELIIASRRARFEVKGHSNKTPALYFNNAIDSHSGLPLQVKVTKTDGMKIRAPYVPDKENLPTGKEIQLTMTGSIDIWLKYVAKVALSSGIFAYGNLFQTDVQSDILRSMVYSDNLPELQENKNIHQLLGGHYLYHESNHWHLDLYKTICESIHNSSCVGIVPSTGAVSFFAGILGCYIGVVTVKANTDNWPNEGAYRDGHFMCVQNGKLCRLSFRRVLEKSIGHEN